MSCNSFPFRLALISLVMSVAWLSGGCSSADSPAPQLTQLVRTAPIEHGRLQHRLAFHGVLLPVVRARLAFQSPGVLASRPAQMGQVVRSGELLATLDNPELGPAQRAAAARLQESLTLRDQAKRDLDRLSALAESGSVGQEQVEKKAAELDSLKANVARAEADLAGTRQRLDDATLLAPFDGVISQIIAEPGEFVSAGQSVMAIGGLDRVEVRVLLPASLLGELNKGDRLTVRVPQLDNATQLGVVTELASIGERETGLFPVMVEMTVDPSKTMIRAGMQAEVEITYADVEGFIVPLAAIVDPVGGSPHVFVAADGQLQKVAVEVQAIANERVVIAAPAEQLAEGQEVVVGGHRSLSDGQEVRISKDRVSP